MFAYSMVYVSVVVPTAGGKVVLRFALLTMERTGPATSSGTEGLTAGAFVEVMFAVFVYEPAVVAVASKTRVTLCPIRSVPVLQVTVPFAPTDGVEVGAGPLTAPTQVKPAGRASETAMPVTSVV